MRRGAPVSAGVPNPDLLTTITVSLILRSSESSTPENLNDDEVEETGGELKSKKQEILCIKYRFSLPLTI